MEPSKEKERIIHVSGHVTKEDLAYVDDVVKPEKLIIHHTSVSENAEKKMRLPIGAKFLHISDGEIIEI